jgi:hypothetical protein
MLVGRFAPIVLSLAIAGSLAGPAWPLAPGPRWTPRQAMLAALDGFDAETYLLAAGVSPSNIEAIRARLLG